MKKYYSKMACLLAGFAMVIGLLGTTERVYAAEETENAAQEVINAEEMADDAMLSEESLETASEESGDFGYASVSTPDGKTISGSIMDDTIPLLFHKINVNYQGQPVEAVQFDNGNIVLVYVTDSSGNTCYMRYDEATGTLSDFRMIPGPSDNYIMVLSPDDSLEPPVGYERAILDWNGQSLVAFINTDSVTQSDTFAGSDAQPGDYFLLYALSSTGREGFYLYDQVEGTYQRYLNLAGASGKSKSSSDKLIDFQAVKEGDTGALVRLIILSVMLLLIIILLITVIILAVKLKDYAGYEYIDEEDYNARNEVNHMSSGSSRHEYRDEEAERTVRDFGDKPDEERSVAPAKSHAQRQERPAEKSQGRGPERSAPRRRNLLETGDIADLDDILNDPDSTSNLPTPEQIEKAAEKKKKTAEVRREEDFEHMQVTVDSFSAGMPAMVDTEIISEDVEDVETNNRTPSGRITGEMEFARDQYSEEKFDGDYHYNDDEYGDDDDEYYSGLSRKERKALEKQRRREEKEAEKDAKYLEKERKRAEKRKKYGYEEPTAMDWTSFSEGMSDDEDDRKPRGNDAGKMPSYMSDRARTEAGEGDGSAAAKPSKERIPTEAERAEAAADAVIRAARGEGYRDDEPEASASDDEYRAYRQGARNQYEEFRHEDEEIARRQAIEAGGRAGNQGRPQASQGRPQPPQGRPQPPQGRPQPPKVEYKQDLDEDFEFDFLDIKRPQ